MLEDAVTDDADLELEELMRGFNPTGDRVDAILLHLLTGEEDSSSALKDWLNAPPEVEDIGDEEEDTYHHFKKVNEDNKNLTIQGDGVSENLI